MKNTAIDLIPDIINPTPDYYCTWQTQLYATSDGKPDENGDVPYLIAAKNPNGVFSVATLGRTKERSYFIPRCRVTAEIGGTQTVGVFGDYEALILKTAGKMPHTVLMQDLAGEKAFDVTEDVSFHDGKLTIPGDLIRQIGTSENPVGDTSEAGLIVKILS